jgi:molybdate transport system substrate-binding protein
MHKFILIVLLISCSSASASESPVVAIAANMTHAMTDIIAQYQQETGIRVRVSYGSSGNFTRQLLQGAPYKLFITAHKKYADMLAEKPKIIDNSTPYVLGRIGLFIPNNSKLAEIETLEAVINALQFEQNSRVVIANPEHAPYGVAAQQALQQASVWTKLHKRLLLAENAAQAAQFTVSGGVDVGIIPSSLAVVPEISRQGKFFLIPESWHQPLEQHLVLIHSAGETVKHFYDYLLSDRTKKILTDYGYSIPTNRQE